MAVQTGIVTVDLSLPLPSECAVDTVYKVQGTAKLLKVVGALPWVYLEVKKKSWYQPENIEAWFTTYEKGLPVPISGDFSINWRPDRAGEYEIRVVATPAPLSLPVVGIPPIAGSSDIMMVTVVGAGVPPVEPPSQINIADIIKTNIALDIRSFLIMLYRLGRAREVRLFSYVAVDAGGTETYTYTIPTDYIYIPHIEEIDLGLQRIITRYDYEGGNLLHTETYATDRTVEWTMTPLSRVVEGSFAVSFYNGGTTDTWVKSRFLGSIMRQSDYLMWRQLVRELSEKYLAFGA